MTAYMMRQRGFAATCAGAGINRAQGVMGAALILLRVRGTAFGCLHGKFFLRFELDKSYGRETLNARSAARRESSHSSRHPHDSRFRLLPQ